MQLVYRSYGPALNLGRQWTVRQWHNTGDLPILLIVPRKKLLLITASIVLLLIINMFVVKHERATAPDTKNEGRSAQSQTPVATFDKKKYPTDKAGSLWWIVNKTYALNPLQYTPPDLETPSVPIRSNAGVDERKVSHAMVPDLLKMFSAAASDGANLMLASGYRSYQTQVAVYNNEVSQYGQAQADRESARPGHSEHQTGLSADLEDAGRTCEVADCFGDLPEGKWLATNAYKYGFIIRYPEGKETITGYRYEPWHVRYVGTELASEMHDTGVVTLEEFFSLQ